MSGNHPETPAILQEIIASTRDDVVARKEAVPLAELEEEVEPRTPGVFTDALRVPGISLIAEHKRRSPSKGLIRPHSSVEEVLESYEASGVVSACSVLTSSHFDGSLADLAEARRTTRLPLLQKEFIVDEYQIYEAARENVDAILLIVCALSDEELEHLSGEAKDLNLDRLVEIHDLRELDRAMEIDPDILGINNRNLHDFSEDLGTTHRLLGHIPDDQLKASESAIRDRSAVVELEEAGVEAVLIGEALMRAEDPGAKAQELMGG